MADRIHTLIIELDDQGQTLTFRHWLPEEDQTVYRRASYRPFDTSIRELADNILDILAQHAGRPSAESLAREQLQHAGSKLYRKVFSGEVADALQKESGNSYLLLNLSLDVLGIPWELLHDGEQFLCQRFKVGRHLEKTHDELTAAKIRVEGKRTGGSLIVFGDTSGLQPGD